MRLLRITVLVGAVTALLAAPAAAAQSNSGCGAAASGWKAVTYQEWLDLTEEYDPDNAPLPVDLVEEILDSLEAVDKNTDGFVCWKEFRPSLLGAWPPGYFLIADNHRAAGDQQ